MKTLVFIAAILLMTSCDVYYVEPVVPAPSYDPRDLFVGSYDLSEYSSTYDEYWDYSVTIYKTGRSELVIDNFYNSGLRVYAGFNGNSIIVPWQIVDGYELQGDGYIEGSRLIITYKVRDTCTQSSAWDFCDASGSRY